MAAKEERDHKDQHVAHVAFKIPVSGGRRRENSHHDRCLRSPSRSPSRPPSPGPYKEDGDICYYHHTYGDQ